MNNSKISWKKLTINSKFSFWIMFILSILIIIVTNIRINRDDKLFTKQFELKNNTNIDLAVLSLGIAINFEKIEDVNNIGRRFIENRDISELYIEDLDKNLIYNEKKNGISYKLENIIYFSKEIIYDGEIVGNLKIGFSNYFKNERLKEIKRNYLIENLILAMLLFIAINVLAKKIIKPIKFLEEEVESIASGDYYTPIEFKSNDEIGRLGEKIEVMRLKILESSDKLNDTNKNLEQIVEQRTNQLIKTNEYLEETLANVEEVQAELIIKNNELEDALDDLRETRTELVQTAKLNLASEVVAGVAHEINTPLGIALTLSTYLTSETFAVLKKYEEKKLTKNDLSKYLKIIDESTKTLEYNMYRATELIANFKEIAVDQTGKVRRIYNLKEYVEKILTSLYPKYKRTSHKIELDIPKNIEIDGYPGAISQVITNLIMNTLVHGFETKEAGKIKIFAENFENKVKIIYKDDGSGIDQEIIELIFDPFFTTKKGNGGSGLGLSIVYNLVTKIMGGTIKCNSEVGNGVEFIIELPKVQEEKI